VWAVDTRHAPMFWFPRDCPRGCIWPVSSTTPEDREEFFGQSAANRVHVMKGGWLRRMQECLLYAYRLPHKAFRPHEVRAVRPRRSLRRRWAVRGCAECGGGLGCGGVVTTIGH